jgi:hypothetical protein
LEFGNVDFYGGIEKNSNIIKEKQQYQQYNRYRKSAYAFTISLTTNSYIT